MVLYYLSLTNNNKAFCKNNTNWTKIMLGLGPILLEYPQIFWWAALSQALI
jgi:hypothetical protein